MFIKTKALILKNRQTETNKFLVTAYTLRFGKILCSARGLEKMEAKLRSALLPFSYTETVLVKTKGKPVIARANLIHDLFPKNNLKSQILSFYFADLTDSLSPQNVKDKRILSLLVKTFSLLSKKQKNSLSYLLVLIYFPLKLMKYLGYLPDLGVCGHCSKKLFSANVFLSYKYGLLCSRCQQYDKKAVRLSHQEINLLRELQQHGLDFSKKYSSLSPLSLQKIALLINLSSFYIAGIPPLSSFGIVESLLLC